MASLRLAIACLLIIDIASAAMNPRKPGELPSTGFDREIPVLLGSATEIDIGISGSAVLECYRGVRLSEIYYSSSDIHFAYSDIGIELRDENGVLTIGLAEIRCIPRNESTLISYGGRSYRGYFRAVYRYDPGEVMLVNVVDLELYLAGVLPGEIGERTPEEFEAAKAQAVAARTYAVWRIAAGGSQGMLFPTIADQVYLGKDAEIELLTKAVLETAGEILTYEKKPIAAYYHAVCGGETLPVEEAWPDKEPTSYLQGTGDDDYCSWAKTYSWSEIFEPSILKKNLERYFIGRGLADSGDFDNLIDIEFFEDNTGDRIELMEITTDKAVFDIERDQIRRALGRPSIPGAILPSTRFKAEISRTFDGQISLLLSGRGNGHGVGLCQCGTIGRARAGQKYDRILKSYYKGARIEKIY